MKEAMLPCFVCGEVLTNAFDVDNQPQEGTEFRTYGHYGSTFWDSPDGEELVLNICDSCLRAGKTRLAQQKRFLPIVAHHVGLVGKQWVDRSMVPYSGHPDDTSISVEPEEMGENIGARVEWADNIEELRAYVSQSEVETI